MLAKSISQYTKPPRIGNAIKQYAAMGVFVVSISTHMALHVFQAAYVLNASLNKHEHENVQNMSPPSVREYKAEKEDSLVDKIDDFFESPVGLSIMLGSLVIGSIQHYQRGKQTRKLEQYISQLESENYDLRQKKQ